MVDGGGHILAGGGWWWVVVGGGGYILDGGGWWWVVVGDGMVQSNQKFYIERNYDVLKSKSPCFLMNKKVNLIKRNGI